jgi:four helix bundle protein
VSAAGANYEEGRGAESRADFIHKVGIATKELREAHFWLQFLHRAHIAQSDLAPLLSEANELIAILVASRKTATTNGPK